MGKKKVQIVAWVDANTDEFKDVIDEPDTWCEDCDSYTELVEKSDFINHNKSKKEDD